MAVAAGDVAADYHSRARRPSVPPSPPSDDNDDRGVFHHSVTRLPSTPHVCLVTRTIGRCKRWKLLVDAGGRKSPVHVHRRPREPNSGLRDRMDTEIARRSVRTCEYIEDALRNGWHAGSAWTRRVHHGIHGLGQTSDRVAFMGIGSTSRVWYLSRSMLGGYAGLTFGGNRRCSRFDMLPRPNVSRFDDLSPSIADAHSFEGDTIAG